MSRCSRRGWPFQKAYPSGCCTAQAGGYTREEHYQRCLRQCRNHPEPCKETSWREIDSTLASLWNSLHYTAIINSLLSSVITICSLWGNSQWCEGTRPRSLSASEGYGWSQGLDCEHSKETALSSHTTTSWKYPCPTAAVTMHLFPPCSLSQRLMMSGTLTSAAQQTCLLNYPSQAHPLCPPQSVQVFLYSLLRLDAIPHLL